MAKEKLSEQEKQAKREAIRQADLDLLSTASELKPGKSRDSILNSLKNKFKETNAWWDKQVEEKKFSRKFADECIALGMVKSTATRTASKREPSAISTKAGGFPGIAKLALDADGNVVNQELASAALQAREHINNMKTALGHGTDKDGNTTLSGVAATLAKYGFDIHSYARFTDPSATKETSTTK